MEVQLKKGTVFFCRDVTEALARGFKMGQPLPLLSNFLFLKKWVNPGLFLFIFGLFKQSLQFLQ